MYCAKAVDRHSALKSFELLLQCMVLPKEQHTNIALLFPFKAEVIKQLAVCLDDKKRAIRLLAVRVRNLWILSL